MVDGESGITAGALDRVGLGDDVNIGEVRVANAKSINYTSMTSVQPIVEPILNVVLY